MAFVRFTRGRRVAIWSAIGVAALVVGVVVAWSFMHTSQHAGAHAERIDFLVVKPADHASLTWDDVRAMQTTMPSVHLVVPYLHKTAQLVAADASWSTVLVGTTPDYFALRSLHVAAGAPFDDRAANDKVVVLGDAVVRQLFGASRDPVGETVRINSTPFTVVGVLAHQGMSAVGQDLDDVAIVPAQVFASRIEATTRFSGSVLVLPESVSESAHVEAELRSLLRVRHRLGPGTDDDFAIRVPPVAN